MALTELEQKRITKVVGAYIETKRPAKHLRNELDLTFVIDGQSVVLIENRLLRDGDRVERPFAKATWVKSLRHWRVYWQRADLKWHSYVPSPTVANLEQFCQVVDLDEYACFWG